MPTILSRLSLTYLSTIKAASSLLAAPPISSTWSTCDVYPAALRRVSASSSPALLSSAPCTPSSRARILAAVILLTFFAGISVATMGPPGGDALSDRWSEYEPPRPRLLCDMRGAVDAVGTRGRES